VKVKVKVGVGFDFSRLSYRMVGKDLPNVQGGSQVCIMNFEGQSYIVFQANALGF